MWCHVHSRLKISLNLDITGEKWFFTAFMMFLACFKIGRYLASKINLFHTLKLGPLSKESANFFNKSWVIDGTTIVEEYLRMYNGAARSPPLWMTPPLRRCRRRRRRVDCRAHHILHNFPRAQRAIKPLGGDDQLILLKVSYRVVQPAMKRANFSSHLLRIWIAFSAKIKSLV